MDYEKKYNKALEFAKEKRDIASRNGADITVKFLEEIFPELADSEDERMINELQGFLDSFGADYFGTGEWQKFHDWLEKQKEQVVDKEGMYYYLGGKFIYCGYPATEENPYDFALSQQEQQKEQKPISTEDMPYVTDEHFFEREQADSFKYRLAEYMTKNCTGYSYSISSESILEMAEEELLKRGVVQKPAEWSEEDRKMIDHLIEALPMWANGRIAMLPSQAEEYVERLKSLRPQPKSQGTYNRVVHTIFGMLKDKDFYGMPSSSCVSLLNDIRVKCKDAIDCAPILDEPRWKPSEEQMEALRRAVNKLAKSDVADSVRLSIMYDNLKKMM